MSQWTHIAGAIRLDCFFPGPQTADEIRRAFGKTFAWEDSQDKWDACTVPYGSEGSVQYDVVQTGGEDENSVNIAWGLVYIHADLRDFSNANAIYDWIMGALHKLADNKQGFSVRSCCVKVDVEFQKSYLIHDNRNGDIVMDELYNQQSVQEMLDALKRKE